MQSRREFLKKSGVVGAGLLMPWHLAKNRAYGQAAAVVQTPLAGSAIPQFKDPLPLLAAAGGTMQTVVAGATETVLNMCEFQANILPVGTIAPGLRTPTWVWGYVNGATPATPQETYIGPVFVATRGVPTQVRYVNNLGNTASTKLTFWTNAIDQTLHWADPLNGEANACHMNSMMMNPRMGPSGACALHYSGPIPAVPHLHGGEVPPVLDGGPDAWFTSDGAYHGHAYYSMAGAGANEAIYRYPNSQEAAMIWFHDHLLGATRLNVYAGLAGAYALTDPALALPPGLHPVGLQQGGTVDYLVPLVIQDRMFDTAGQLFFPSGPPFNPNPEHPFWVPEFMGDAIVVNGKTWPFLNVAPKRYRFLLINGSNARTYELFLINQTAGGAVAPAIWQIGTDGGYLDAPVKIDPALGQVLRIMPGERADVIIDFGGLPTGTTLLMRNSGRTPYPKGPPPQGATVGRIVQFRVNQPLASPDASYNPASGVPLRPPMVRLVSPATGALAVPANKTRQLTLNEVLAPPSLVNGIAYPGGPMEILVNNTRWDGKRPDGTIPAGFVPVTVNGITTCYSELPNEGETEVWEFVNLTADAHPMHTHLVQFQLINRQAFNMNKYPAAYAAAFPGRLYIPAYGPPLNYNTGNLRALGGNPDIRPFLQGAVQPPAPNEAGWKDVVMVPPGMVTRLAVRFTPTDTLANAAGNFPFDPNAAGHGYVVHCHIIDHEDNEMMRPDMVVPKQNVGRSIVLGTHY